jgi:ribosomal protein L32
MPANARVDSVDLTSVAQELYSLTPDKFTANRNERAKSARADGESQMAASILSLPKPSAAAWAVNLLVRERGEDIDQLVALGNLLREAQSDLDSDALKDLSRQRRKLVAALGQQAAALAAALEHGISAATLEDVEQTLQAAMADPRAAVAVRSGRLTRALGSVGLEPVELAGAVGAPEEGMLDVAPAPTARTEDDRSHARARVPKRKVSEARQKAKDAAQDAENAAAALTAVDDRVGEIDRRHRDLTTELADLKSRMTALEAKIAEAEGERRRIQRERDKAARAAGEARDQADRAQEHLDGLL